MIRETIRTAVTFAMLFLPPTVPNWARADEPPHSERNRNYILRRQQVVPGLGTPTTRLIIGKREIDIYPNGLMFERDHVVGIKPR
jgi:hypothetical protein